MALKTYTFQEPQGLNTMQSPANLSDKYAVLFENAIIDDSGAIAKRFGYVKSGSAISGNPLIKNLFLYIKNDGSKTKIAAAGNSLYKQNADGTWTAIKTGLSSTAKFTAVNFQNKIIFFNGYDMPFYYDGSSCTNVSGTPTEWTTGNCPSIVYLHKNRLFAGGLPSNLKMVYYSALGKINDWTTANDAGYINLAENAHASSMLTDIMAWEGYLVFFLDEESLIWSWDTPSTSSLSKILPVGAYYGRVQRFGNDLIFLSTSGLKTLTRSLQSGQLNIQNISDAVENYIQDLIRLASDISTAIYPFKRWVLLFFGVYTLVYDYDHKAWYRFSGIDAQSFLTDEADLYFGDSNGQLYIFDDEIYSDDGEAISMTYQTPWLHLGKISTYKKPVFLTCLIGEGSLGEFEMKQFLSLRDSPSVTTTKTMTISDNSYWRSSYWRVSLWRSLKIRQYKIPLGGRGDLVAYKFSHSEESKQFSIVLNELIFRDGGFR